MFLFWYCFLGRINTKEYRMETVAITLTPAAVARVKELISDAGDPGLKLRVFITGGGCSGFNYGFAFEGVSNDDDTSVEIDGVTCLVDAISIQYLVGAEVDFEEKLEGSRFIIKNPNAQSTCGCGSSFSV